MVKGLEADEKVDRLLAEPHLRGHFPIAFFRAQRRRPLSDERPSENTKINKRAN